MPLRANEVFDQWFLTPAERGNRDTSIDTRRRDGAAYTVGNRVTVLVDGAAYFRRLHDLLLPLQRGDRVFFTDWRGDPDECLVGAGTEIGGLLARLARRGVDVRGLVWRSHLDRAHFSERENRTFSEVL